MNAEQINIDDFVDYAAEYKSVIKGAKITGDRIIGRCPFHDDNKDSFAADLKTGIRYEYGYYIRRSRYRNRR